jgi:peptidoglycan/LPS O-acetylase OafA/YrhL
VKQTRVFGLDVMRAIAIALVLFSHTTIWFFTWPMTIRAGVIGAYLGVELFFVLSGFLIGGILLRALAAETTQTTLLSFWQRRWMRTLPNYFLFLLLNVLLSIFLLHNWPPLVRYFFFGQNFLTPSPEFFSESWSLAIEEWFYLLVPILFFAARKIAPQKFSTATFAIVLGLIVSITLIRSVYVLIAHPAWLRGVRVIVLYRLDACMFGVLAAWVKFFRPGIWSRASGVVFCAGLALLLFVSSLPFTLPADSIVLHTIGFTLTSLGSAFLLPALDRWTVRPRWGSPIVRLSLCSYSLYLVNMPMFLILTHALPAEYVFAGAATFVVLSILAAAIIYRLFEKPMMDLRDRSHRRGDDALVLAQTNPAAVVVR